MPLLIILGLIVIPAAFGIPWKRITYWNHWTGRRATVACLTIYLVVLVLTGIAIWWGIGALVAAGTVAKSLASGAATKTVAGGTAGNIVTRAHGGAPAKAAEFPANVAKRIPFFVEGVLRDTSHANLERWLDTLSNPVITDEGTRLAARYGYTALHAKRRKVRSNAEKYQKSMEEALGRHKRYRGQGLNFGRASIQIELLNYYEKEAWKP
ncbi:hypothetical protein Caci_3854 [Catenulispora acidiphila DSM 44928]|uniref:Uncharacterized protein n=1 Tax=Catenulispora acidiphila (strain DSM 44928 / JCM 14897 / NBRC 102108 / NRRL B-24433 / ID139908) TaxID=479433 RepID=C7QDF6_CATAD|nr:hypothetical protein [Catenulispora acidiphila]ACU72749.1 hypothetical protein Caci_3854 [Catenulispora acidiphila DSM 44928]